MSDNWTKLSNDFTDVMYKYKPYVWGVYMYLSRRIKGWHKEEDAVSLTQLMAATGLTKPSLIKAVKVLIADGWITQKKIDRKNVYTIECKNSDRDGKQHLPLEGVDSKQHLPSSDVDGKQHLPLTPEIVNDIYHDGKQHLPQVVNGIYPQKKYKEIYKEIYINKEKEKEKETETFVAQSATHLAPEKIPKLKNKDVKDVKEPKDTTAYHEIDALFKAGSEKLTGIPYYRDGKEAKNIKLLEPRYLQDSEKFKDLARKYYNMIKFGGDFWAGQSFTPSMFNSHYNRVAAFKPPEKVIKQIQVQEVLSEPYEAKLLRKYGHYEEADLRYLVEHKVILREDADYIRAQRVLPC
jgi:hypothetical protein